MDFFQTIIYLNFAFNLFDNYIEFKIYFEENRESK